MQLGVSDLGLSLGISAERVKQLIKEFSLNNIDFSSDINKSSKKWLIGANAAKTLTNSRNMKFPNGKIIVIGAQKGGVGKTTLTVNTASFLGSLGLKILVVDTDPESHATSFLKEEEHDESELSLYEIFLNKLPLSKIIKKSRFTNVDYTPSSIRGYGLERLLLGQNPRKLISEKIQDIKNNYNIIFLEVGPAMTTVSASSYLTANEIYIPVTPDSFSLESLPFTIETIKEYAKDFDKKESIKFKVIFNGYVESQKSSQDALKILLNEYSEYLLPYYIRGTVDVRNFNNEGKTLFESNNKSLKLSLHKLAMEMADNPILLSDIESEAVGRA